MNMVWVWKKGIGVKWNFDYRKLIKYDLSEMELSDKNLQKNSKKLSFLKN